MRREEVARNQRARLYGAMIEAVSQRGYRHTTVADVLALAGVSRRAFYEQFANKQACFLATYDIVVARERKRLIDAWQGERGWSNRLHAACKALLDGAACDPRGARLVLIEALGAGSSASERMQLAGAIFERLTATAYRLAPNWRELPPLAPRAIVSGVRHIVVRRLLEGREHELYWLTDEVLDWVESYRSPALPLAPAPAVPARVPTISRPMPVATGAGESATLEVLIVESLEAARGPLLRAASWACGVHRAIGALVEYLVRHGELLRRVLFEPLESGSATLVRTLASLEELASVLTEFAPAPRRAPQIAREAVAGALWGIIASYAPRTRIARLPRAVDEIAFAVLAPFLGARAAAEAIRASCACSPIR
jgi:AcrR family transcriptional regulator